MSEFYYSGVIVDVFTGKHISLKCGEAIDQSSADWNLCCFSGLDVNGRGWNFWISAYNPQESSTVGASMNLHSACNVLFALPSV